MANSSYLPIYFIVGAAIAGTSSIWRDLKNQYEIIVPEGEVQKESGFFSRPGKVFKDIPRSLGKTLIFLGVNRKLEVDYKKIFNRSYKVRAPWLKFSLIKLTIYLKRLGVLRYNSKKERDQLMVLGITKKKTPIMNPALRSLLLIRYKPDISKLEHLLKRNLKIWF